MFLVGFTLGRLTLNPSPGNSGPAKSESNSPNKFLSPNHFQSLKSTPINFCNCKKNVAPIMDDKKNNFSGIILQNTQGRIDKKESSLSTEMDPIPTFQDGFAAFSQGDIEEAQRIWEQALLHNPTDIELLQSLSMVYEGNGKYPEFVNKFKEIIETTPDTISLYSELASSLNAHSQPSEALQILEEGVASNPNDPDFYYLLGDYLAENGDYSSAILNYEKALAIKPDDALAHFFLGQLYLKINNKEIASRELEIASQLSSEVAVEVEEFYRQF